MPSHVHTGLWELMAFRSRYCQLRFHYLPPATWGLYLVMTGWGHVLYWHFPSDSWGQRLSTDPSSSLWPVNMKILKGQSVKQNIKVKRIWRTSSVLHYWYLPFTVHTWYHMLKIYISLAATNRRHMICPYDLNKWRHTPFTFSARVLNLLHNIIVTCFLSWSTVYQTIKQKSP